VQGRQSAETKSECEQLTKYAPWSLESEAIAARESVRSRVHHNFEAIGRVLVERQKNILQQAEKEIAFHKRENYTPGCL
jgi:hypothetical protein